ncbi:hypothetical protein HPB52_008910 [Rhipicephalus sanguineus]|uniref:Uncharacterized protein n=1 Tax=Rhipicephalus sanguineus TaxID=34632 RepID=A0A9D4PZ42_RHISA|nr:hypothetical protein HPB52_008910 [Rhipicephalus sanguineus]
MATYHHIMSNDNVANHTLCPAGPNSWCKQNAAKAKVEAAVAEAALKFNACNERASEDIMKELSLNASWQSRSRIAEKDRRRMAASAKKRQTTEDFHRSLQKRHTGATNQKDYMPGAY